MAFLLGKMRGKKTQAKEPAEDKRAKAHALKEIRQLKVRLMDNSTINIYVSGTTTIKQLLDIMLQRLQLDPRRFEWRIWQRSEGMKGIDQHVLSSGTVGHQMAAWAAYMKKKGKTVEYVFKFPYLTDFDAPLGPADTLETRLVFAQAVHEFRNVPFVQDVGAAADIAAQLLRLGEPVLGYPVRLDGGSPEGEPILEALVPKRMLEEVPRAKLLSEILNRFAAHEMNNTTMHSCYELLRKTPLFGMFSWSVEQKFDHNLEETKKDDKYFQMVWNYQKSKHQLLPRMADKKAEHLVLQPVGTPPKTKILVAVDIRGLTVWPGVGKKDEPVPQSRFFSLQDEEARLLCWGIQDTMVQLIVTKKDEGDSAPRMVRIDFYMRASLEVTWALSRACMLIEGKYDEAEIKVLEGCVMTMNGE